MYEFTEESFKKNTIGLQNAYDRETQSTAQIEDTKKQVELARQNIIAQENQMKFYRRIFNMQP